MFAPFELLENYARTPATRKSGGPALEIFHELIEASVPTLIVLLALLHIRKLFVVEGDFGGLSQVAKLDGNQ
jgi:hypothetical protein